MENCSLHEVNMYIRKLNYLKGDVVVGSRVVTMELQPLLVTVRARGGRDSAGLLGTCSQLNTYLSKLNLNMEK
jgi:hypothetical protein